METEADAAGKEAMMSDARFYVFGLTDLPDGMPYGKTTDGGFAVFVFSSAANALKFAVAKGHNTDWRVRELNALDAKDWLECAIEGNGITGVWRDPDPSQEGWKETPVAVFLAILDVLCQ